MRIFATEQMLDKLNERGVHFIVSGESLEGLEAILENHGHEWVDEPDHKSMNVGAFIRMRLYPGLAENFRVFVRKNLKNSLRILSQWGPQATSPCQDQQR